MQDPDFDRVTLLSKNRSPNQGTGHRTGERNRAGQPRLTVLEARGRVVSRLTDGPRTAGRHTVRFDAYDLPSGTYFARLETASGSKTQPVTVVR